MSSKLINMHQIIEQILGSTRKRVPSYLERSKITSKDLKKIIQDKKEEDLIPVISEVKPSSPSRFIRNVTPIDAAEIAIDMQHAGASGISVLTEPDFFKGSMQNLMAVRENVRIPVLRKDFIIDKNQIYEVESDLILLIAGILGDKLEDFVNEALISGREPLVEVHNAEELENALSTKTDIIGINNRDLTTMKVDIAVTEVLAPLISGRIIISESGISSPHDAARMIEAGADAVLVGTSIMQGDIYERTHELVYALKNKG